MSKMSEGKQMKEYGGSILDTGRRIGGVFSLFFQQRNVPVTYLREILPPAPI
jgi:hypothetical protein